MVLSKQTRELMGRLKPDFDICLDFSVLLSDCPIGELRRDHVKNKQEDR